MKSSITHLLLSVIFLVTAFSGCSRDEAPDNRDHGYGYAQFKIYKEASYAGTKASNSKLDRLSDACKIKVTLLYNNTTITQTIVLSARDEEDAEYGLRSDKLKLVTGDYQLQSFILYDKLDKEVYIEQIDNNSVLNITEGGLTVLDLTVNATQRGHVKFTFIKALNVDTKASDSKYTFDEIAYVSLSLRELSTSETMSFDNLPTTFDIHFDESGTGHQVSTLVTDTIPAIKAGKWRITSYTARNSDKSVLEVASTPTTEAYNFTVNDNQTAQVEVPITLNESAEYIKDYLALREIWQALDGPSWSYHGESFTTGTNWDFNKDVDLWGDQPGVQLHSNGRVALLNLSEFGIKGAMPAAIGQLTQLVELILGTHNDNNDEYVASTVGKALNGTLASERMALGKEYLESLYGNPCNGLSVPLRRAYVDLNKAIPGGLTLNDQRKAEWEENTPVTRADTQYGTICNHLTSLPPEIGKLKNLESLSIANSTISSLPDEVADLSSVTDLEVYNCPMMTKFPMALTRMPALVSVNISQNKQWSASEVYKGLDGLATGPSAKLIQLLYENDGNLEEVPESFSNFSKMGLLALTSNNISKIHPLGKNVHPSQLMYDNNLITEIPVGDDGYFCGFDDNESVTFSYNKLTKVPNMFSSIEGEEVGTADFSFNEITGFDESHGEFRTMNMTQLNLEGNELTEYPAIINRTDSRVQQVMLKGNKISSFPENSFTGKYAYYLQSLDLSYNRIKALPSDFDGVSLPYLYGIDLSSNAFSSFPYRVLDCSYLTALIIRGQRDDNGNRCLKEWPTGIYNHKGLRALYIGSNDLRKIDDTISYLIYYLDIADNPNIVFDASDICYYIQSSAFFFFYDKTQDIRGCDYLDLAD